MLLLPYHGSCCDFLSGTFLSSVQKRVQGGDSDLEPIDSWLIAQGMVRSHQLSRAPCPPALPVSPAEPCESDSARPCSPSDWAPNCLLSLHSLLSHRLPAPENTSSGFLLRSGHGPAGSGVRSGLRGGPSLLPCLWSVRSISFSRMSTGHCGFCFQENGLEASDQLVKPLQPVTRAVLG